MTNYLYPAGLDLWDTNWPTLDLNWLLVDATGGFSPNADTVADLVPDEITVAGYVRQPVVGALRGVRPADTNMQQWDYAAESPAWTGLAAGQQVGGLVLYSAGADDATSIPLAWWNFQPALDTGAGSLDFSFTPLTNWNPAAPPAACLLHTYWVQT